MVHRRSVLKARGGIGAQESREEGNSGYILQKKKKSMYMYMQVHVLGTGKALVNVIK